MQTIKKNKKWELVKLPKEAIKCKWIFKAKYKSNRTVDNHKARLVTKGFTHKEGVDYEEILTPVAKIDTIITVLALVTWYNWIVNQIPKQIIGKRDMYAPNKRFC